MGILAGRAIAERSRRRDKLPWSPRNSPRTFASAEGKPAKTQEEITCNPPLRTQKGGFARRIVRHLVPVLDRLVANPFFMAALSLKDSSRTLPGSNPLLIPTALTANSKALYVRFGN
jgi:hypothetical protein